MGTEQEGGKRRIEAVAACAVRYLSRSAKLGQEVAREGPSPGYSVLAKKQADRQTAGTCKVPDGGLPPVVTQGGSQKARQGKAGQSLAARTSSSRGTWVARGPTSSHRCGSPGAHMEPPVWAQPFAAIRDKKRLAPPAPGLSDRDSGRPGLIRAMLS